MHILAYAEVVGVEKYNGQACEDWRECPRVSHITQASPKAKVFEVITEPSPNMKESRGKGYFDSEISDGRSAMWVYGYNKGVQKKLEYFKVTKTSLAIASRKVKNLG